MRLDNRAGRVSRYDEGNVQVMWRTDIGHTAEQYANVSLIRCLLMPSVQSFHFSKDKLSLGVANQIVEMHAADYPVEDISEATGLSMLDVSGLLQKWGHA